MAKRLHPGFRRRCWHLFSTTFRYALISLVELAVEARTLQARQIAAKFALSPHDLAVVLRDLRRLGLVESIKGNQGGYRLCRPVPLEGGPVAGGAGRTLGTGTGRNLP